MLQAAVPAQQMVVEAADRRVDGQAEQADGDHAGDDLVRPHELAGFEDAESEAVIDRDHLGDDDHDEGGADADAHAGQDVRRGGGQDDAGEHRPLPDPEVARGADVDAVDLADAGDGVHQHREEGADGDPPVENTQLMMYALMAIYDKKRE